MRALARRCAVPIHLHLLDISPAFAHGSAPLRAADLLGDSWCFCVSGNLGICQSTQTVNELLRVTTRQRLATLLGYTLGNMENEVRFLQTV